MADSILSRVKNPWADQVVISNYDLGDKVSIRDTNKIGTVVKISMAPKVDREVPHNLKHHNVAYCVEQQDDYGSPCRFWYGVNELQNVREEMQLNESQLSDNTVHTRE